MTIDKLYGSSGVAVDNSTMAEPKASWVGGNYIYPHIQTYPVVYSNTPQKSDVPYVVATLAQLLAEEKISEDTFLRLTEKLIQQVR